ncbi:MAG: hypothetical protein ACOCSG_00280 [Guyparkeria sp.]
MQHAALAPLLAIGVVQAGVHSPDAPVFDRCDDRIEAVRVEPAGDIAP